MKLLAVATVAGAITGCVSVNKNDGANECLQPKILKDAAHYKYDIKKKAVEGTETIQWINLGFISFAWGGTADHIADHAPMSVALPFVGPSVSDIAKNGAYAKACAASGADSLVASRYKVTNTSYFVYGTAKADVKGYPATVVDVEVVPAQK